MIYNIILGLISVMFGYFVYTGAGLVDPIKTLAAAVFLVLAVAIFIDTTDESLDGELDG